MSISTKVLELTMPRCKSSFQESRKTNAQWKSWIKAGSDEYHAYCDLCKRDFSVAAHGSNAVTQHANTELHKQAVTVATADVSVFKGDNYVNTLTC